MSYNKLLIDDYVPYAPDEEGTIQICHKDNCDNGTDHKERLAITRDADGKIKAFCHNCQSAGVYTPTEYVRSIESITNESKGFIIGDSLQLPEDYNQKIEEWPIPVRAEFFKYDLQYQEIAGSQFGYSASLKRLIIPIYDKAGVLRRWEGRNFGTKGPKYIKHKLPGATDLFNPADPHWLPVDMLSEDTVVVCEDALSAMRLRRHVHARALGGVDLPSDELVKLAGDFKRIVIFLDDDGEPVRQAKEKIILDADVLMEAIPAYNPDAKDPKRYDRTQLRHIIQETLR